MMLHAMLRCLVQRKGTWVCALSHDIGPQNRCLFPADGLQPQGHRAVILLACLDLAGLGLEQEIT